MWRSRKKAKNRVVLAAFSALVTTRAIYRIEANIGDLLESCQKIVNYRMILAQNRAKSVFEALYPVFILRSINHRIDH